MVLVQLNKTSDEAIALSLYSVSDFFLEKTQCFGHLELGGYWWRLEKLVMTGAIWRKHEKQEKLSQKSVMSVCACVVISFPTGCIIFTTNYSICNEAEITEISSHAPWHTPGTHGSYIKIARLFQPRFSSSRRDRCEC